MALSKEQIAAIAKLARLKLTPQETAMYQEQFGSILAYVDKLQELDTKDVPELAFAVATTNILREDEATHCDASVRNRLVAGFPMKKGDLLEVQAVFEDRTE